MSLLNTFFSKIIDLWIHEFYFHVVANVTTESILYLRKMKFDCLKKQIYIFATLAENRGWTASILPSTAASWFPLFLSLRNFFCYQLKVALSLGILSVSGERSWAGGAHKRQQFRVIVAPGEMKTRGSSLCIGAHVLESAGLLCRSNYALICKFVFVKWMRMRRLASLWIFWRYSEI